MTEKQLAYEIGKGHGRRGLFPIRNYPKRIGIDDPGLQYEYDDGYWQGVRDRQRSVRQFNRMIAMD